MPRRKHLDTGRPQPSNWPNHIRFLQSSQYHTSVPPAVRQHILVNEGSLQSHGDLKVHIRSITSSSHPACGQLGLFAGQKIPPKCHIIQYLGKHADLHSLINKNQYFEGEIHCDERDSDYDLSLCRLSGNVSVGIDASMMGNQARFINDYRGIANKPNAIFQDGRTPSGELCMNVWSSGHEIKKWEEIVVSYGKSWWKSRHKDEEEIDRNFI